MRTDGDTILKIIEPSEAQEQAAVVQWWRIQYPRHANLLFHIPNGGLRNKIVAVHLKREGVVRGVADMFLAMPCRDIHGLFIEMKRAKGGRQTPEQKAFEELVMEQGYLYHVCHGSAAAISVLRAYWEQAIR